MIENGMRLRITVIGKDITILDTVSEGTIIYRNGLFLMDRLVHEEVLDNITGLQQLLMSNPVKRQHIKRVGEFTSGLSITELEHCVTQFKYDSEEALLSEGSLKCSRKFSVDNVMSKLSQVVAVLARKGNTILSPKHNICRRLSDLGLFVIKDNNHQIVCREANRQGNRLINCLFDNMTLTWLYVDVHAEEKKVYLFNYNCSLVAEFDYDESFDVYFVADNNVFEEDS